MLDQPVQPAGAAGVGEVASVATTAVQTNTPFVPLSPTTWPVAIATRRSLNRDLSRGAPKHRATPDPVQDTIDPPSASKPASTATRIVVDLTQASTISPAPTWVSTLPGQPAAPFQLAALNAPGVETFSLDSLQGRPVLLSFFATWCTSCRQEMPLFREAFARYHDRVQFILIDLGEHAPRVKQYIRDFQLPFPVLLDPKYTLERPYRVRGLPTSYFLDPHGRIVDQYLGVMTEKALQQRLDRLLGQ